MVLLNCNFRSFLCQTILVQVGSLWIILGPKFTWGSFEVLNKSNLGSLWVHFRSTSGPLQFQISSNSGLLQVHFRSISGPLQLFFRFINAHFMANFFFGPLYLGSLLIPLFPKFTMQVLFKSYLFFFRPFFHKTDLSIIIDHKSPSLTNSSLLFYFWCIYGCMHSKNRPQFLEDSNSGTPPDVPTVQLIKSNTLYQTLKCEQKRVWKLLRSSSIYCKVMILVL